MVSQTTDCRNRMGNPPTKKKIKKERMKSEEKMILVGWDREG